MKLRTVILSLLSLIILLPGAAIAQTDSVGVVDTVYADVAKVDDNNWAVTFSLTNDDHVVGMSIPFKIKSGLNKIVADSVTYTDRVNSFVYKTLRADTAIQCVTVGLIANLGGGQRNRCNPGSGPVATVYISSIEDKPIENLDVDTTTTYPNNELMVVADLIQGDPPNETKISQGQMSIYPAWVLRPAATKEE